MYRSLVNNLHILFKDYDMLANFATTFKWQKIFKCKKLYAEEQICKSQEHLVFSHC